MNKSLQFSISPAHDQIKDAVALFQEYASSLNISLDFQHFEDELKQVEKMYGPPDGRLIVVYDESIAVACAAFRKIEQSVCEVKRMYVKPAYRNLHIADEMMDILIKKAAVAGYSVMKLDTLDTMTPAITLYKKHGFYEIGPYYFNPNKNAVYMERKL